MTSVESHRSVPLHTRRRYLKKKYQTATAAMTRSTKIHIQLLLD
ncbi:MAG TPA: hypothetical protein VFS38_04715 [Actinomycetota bacterium]|nr:hypothetical protein [Actinomycetota bacterium]